MQDRFLPLSLHKKLSLIIYLEGKDLIRLSVRLATATFR